MKLVSLDVTGPGTGPLGLRPGRRMGKWIWFERDQAPGFTDKEGWFEIERVSGWRIVRQVAKPPGE